jgi:hypothetical protein
VPNRQAPRFPACPLCNEPVEINTAKTDSHGKAVHEECYVIEASKFKAISTDVLDYPGNLSMYEKESLAAEAKLKADKKKPSRR